MKMKKLHRSSGVFALALLLSLTMSAAVLFLKADARSSPKSYRATPSAFQNTALVQRYQQMITPGALASSLYFLASDMFEGRETGTRGQKLAADYLASQYRRMGLAPKGSAGAVDALGPSAYFQRFTLYRREPRSASLEVRAADGQSLKSSYSQEAQDDLAYFAFGKQAAARGGVIFAGYGIADDALGYNDFAALKEKGLDVSGKWIMILANEPLKDASTSLLPTKDGKPSRWTTRIYDKKLAIWLSGKPAGVLVISDADARAPEGGFAEQARRAAQPTSGVGNLGLRPASENSFPSTYFISTKLADRILSASGRTVKDLAGEINSKLKPVVFDVKGAEVSSSVEQSAPVETENVLAFIEGSDPKLKSEVVVVSAHYDHLGMNRQLKGDQIFNGAADDGSGTVATLALAESFMRAKADGNGPRRSILFLNTSGEEKGTLGSAFFTDNQPVVPLDTIVANINMDGIGGEDTAHARTNPNYIYVVGLKELSAGLMDEAKRLNQLTGTNLLLDDSQNFPSDQRNFEKMFVPFIYYSTGLTEHYHKVSDEAGTINYEHMAQVARLVFATAWQVANSDTAPPRVSANELVQKGYRCPPCPLECDALTFEEGGVCPVCEMSLYPKYEVRQKSKGD
jgi:hypothetical protein